MTGTRQRRLMEGDSLASAAFWNLARTSGGAYMGPSRDWP